MHLDNSKKNTVVDNNIALESNKTKYTPLHNEEYISSNYNSHEDDTCEDYLEAFDGQVDMKMNASLMALVSREEDQASLHKDVENQQQHQQQYSSSSMTSSKLCDKAKETSENVPDEWVTLGAFYVCFHKLLVVIYSAFIVLTIYNTVDVARDRHEDFQVTLSTDTTIDQLVQIIEKRIGRFGTCTLCKDEFRETNEMTDGKMKLKEYGIQGSKSKECAPRSIICYDVKPFECISREPILLSWVDE